MREGRNIVFIAQSLDGYIAGPDGEIDWLDMVANPCLLYTSPSPRDS